MDANAEAHAVALLDDQPAATDLLNFGEFATALRDVIVDPRTKTPFIIGVIGRWGTGKTTLMRMIERQLETHAATTVWFSAWAYGQEEQIWAAFLQSLTTRLSARLRWSDKLRFTLHLFTSGLVWSRLLIEAPRLLARAAFAAAPVLLGMMLAAAAESRFVQALMQTGGAAGSAFIALRYLFKPLLKAVREEVRPDFSLYQAVDFEQHVGFLERFRDQFGRIVQALPARHRRVVVFVDDLDRCGPDKALELLDAIKVFLDVRDCVFVLGLDQTVIQQALAAKYEGDPVAQKEYLSKIIQLPFHLPPLGAEELANYLRQLDVQLPHENCRDVFLAALAPNPREIKRVINTFSLHWILAQTRASGADIAPVRLAKVIVIQQAFPTLFAMLRDRPEWLGLLERAIRGGAQAPDQAAPNAPATEAIEATTVAMAPSGVALPPALLPFHQEPALVRLLTMHTAQPLDEGMNFAHLSAAEIARYFTLTRRVAPAPEVPAGPAPAAPTAAPFDLPDFGPAYIVQSRLGSGGSSEVFAAQQRGSGARVAIKRLLGTLADDPDWRARFQRESQTLAALPRHPNLVNVIDQGAARDVDGRAMPFYVMDAAGGETLQDLLKRQGRLGLGQARQLLEPIFDALAFLHDHGILHRDLKPSSIVVTATGVPKLVDFGLAVRPVEGRDNLTSVGMVLGTPYYMSPEQLQDRPLDARSDLFALGVIVYECLTGKRPFEGASAVAIAAAVLQTAPAPPSRVLDTASASIDAFMARMLARDPAARFADARAARDAFVEALAVPA